MSDEIEGIIEVKNVWCGCCGRQRFHMHQSFMLTCICCESDMKFTYMSGGVPSYWYVNHGPAIPHAPNFLDIKEATRMGIEWIPFENSDIYHAREKYNCNTGKLNGDVRVIRRLNKEIKKLLHTVKIKERQVSIEESKGQ